MSGLRGLIQRQRARYRPYHGRCRQKVVELLQCRCVGASAWPPLKPCPEDSLASPANGA